MQLGDYRLTAGVSGSDRKLSKRNNFEKLTKLKTKWQQQSGDKKMQKEIRKTKNHWHQQKIDNTLIPELRTQGTAVLSRVESQQ